MSATPAAYQPTDRTVPTRRRDRAAYDKEVVHAILDEGYVCHLGLVRDGAPVVLPTLYARVGERLYLHGSTGSGPMLAAGTNGAGLPVCVTITHIDELVLTRSAMHHSVNYRSVVVYGTARPVTGQDEKAAALDALVDHVVPGRSGDIRRASDKEMAATAVLALDLEEVSAKVRDSAPNDDPEDLSLPYWSGTLPVSLSHGAPVPAPGLDASVPVPDYLTAYARP